MGPRETKWITHALTGGGGNSLAAATKFLITQKIFTETEREGRRSQHRGGKSGQVFPLFPMLDLKKKFWQQIRQGKDDRGLPVCGEDQCQRQTEAEANPILEREGGISAKIDFC